MCQYSHQVPESRLRQAQVGDPLTIGPLYDEEAETVEDVLVLAGDPDCVVCIPDLSELVVTAADPRERKIKVGHRVILKENPKLGCDRLIFFDGDNPEPITHQEIFWLEQDGMERMEFRVVRLGPRLEQATKPAVEIPNTLPPDSELRVDTTAPLIIAERVVAVAILALCTIRIFGL